MGIYTVRKSLKSGADSETRTPDLLITKPITTDGVSPCQGKQDSTEKRCEFGQFPALGPRFLADFEAAFATPTTVKTGVTP